MLSEERWHKEDGIPGESFEGIDSGTIESLTAVLLCTMGGRFSFHLTLERNYLRTLLQLIPFFHLGNPSFLECWHTEERPGTGPRPRPKVVEINRQDTLGLSSTLYLVGVGPMNSKSRPFLAPGPASETYL